MAEGGAERVILVAVDGSEQAWEAFVYYRDCLHRPENIVKVFYCYETTAQGLVNYDRFLKAIDAQDDKFYEMQSIYHNAVKKLKGNRGAFVMRRGEKAGQSIIDFATKNGVSMVMMGSRGLGRFRRTIMGSVSDYVVNHARCPVTVYKRNKTQ